jgi:exonuclease SbcC
MTGLSRMQNPFLTARDIFMIIKRIEITNIRSYKEKTSIEFPKGTILFQGDIGSGKSTILSAIEFALFGLGDIDANYLLRIGETKGSVLLEFESGGKTYDVFRSLLRKGNKISQEEGSLLENGLKNSYSVSELKSRILEIIGINERTQTRTTSTIFRFAIYTPQEMMKNVLTSNNERRVEILRRAFGIEEYSTAKKNAEKFSSWIRIVTRAKKSLISELSLYRIDLQKVKKTTESLHEEIDYFKDNVSQLSDQLQNILTKMLETRKRKEKILKAESSILHLQSTIEKISQLLEEKDHEIKKIDQDLFRITQSEKLLVDLTPKYREYIQKRNELVDVTDKALQYDKLLLEKVRMDSNISSERDSLNANIQRLEFELSELTSERARCNHELRNLDGLKQQENSLKNNSVNADNLQIDLDRITGDLLNIKSEMFSINNELLKQKSELDAVLQLRQDAVCPYCKQRLDQQHISELERKFSQRKDLLNIKLGKLEDDRKELNEQKNQVSIKIRQVESERSALQKIQIQIAKLVGIQSNLIQLDLKINEKISNKNQMIAKLQNQNLLDKISKLNDMNESLNKLHPYKKNYDLLNKVVIDYQRTDLEKRFVENTNLINSKQRLIEDKKNRENALLELNNEISELLKKLDETKIIYQDSEKVDIEMKALELKKTSFEGDLIDKKENLASRKADYENNLKQIETFNKKIIELEEKVDRIAFTDQIGLWLNQHFIPSLVQIESQVLVSVKEEFNKLFQKWFYLLIEAGDIDIEIDEFFTPIVNQSGYRLEIDSLSGGEKTSIALAYRLALNEIIRRMIMFDDNLLILDEPTDGFSKEQLVQIQRVLEELTAAQVIIVSHEKELEGFVETIFRVAKESEKSQVELVA